MNEMIPKPNTAPAEINPKTEEVVLDTSKLTQVTELAPSVLTLDEVGAELGAEIEGATDYPTLMDVLASAITKYGHQTVETIMLARFTNEPTAENKAYLKLVGGINEYQTIPAEESLKEPEFEGMGSLLEVVNKFTQEDINAVASITASAEGLASPERKRMKDAIAPLYKLACKQRWETKADLDTDHTLYPEFWQIFDKFEAMHRAVGVINMIEKTVRHDISVK